MFLFWYRFSRAACYDWNSFYSRGFVTCFVISSNRQSPRGFGRVNPVLTLRRRSVTVPFSFSILLGIVNTGSRISRFNEKIYIKILDFVFKYPNFVKTSIRLCIKFIIISLILFAPESEFMVWINISDLVNPESTDGHNEDNGGTGGGGPEPGGPEPGGSQPVAPPYPNEHEDDESDPRTRTLEKDENEHFSQKEKRIGINDSELWKLVDNLKGMTEEQGKDIYNKSLNALSNWNAKGLKGYPPLKRLNLDKNQLKLIRAFITNTESHGTLQDRRKMTSQLLNRKLDPSTMKIIKNLANYKKK